MDGYQLVTQIAQAPLANVVDPNYSATVKIAKSLLPPAGAYGGIHATLRQTTAALR
jgi:hypothetical protein